MHQIVNAVRPGLIGPGAALYGYLMEWRTSNRSGRPLSMGDTLRLMGAGSATFLHSSAPALLHALRTRCPRDPYLKQARAIYPGAVSELDLALHLLHSPDEDLEVGKVTIFRRRRGPDAHPPLPNEPGVRRHQAVPPIRRRVRGVPQRAHLVFHPPTGHTRAPRLGRPAPVPPPLQDRGCPSQRAGPLARAPEHPPAHPRHHDPRGVGAGPGGRPDAPLPGSACAPPPLPAPEARDGLHALLRTQEVTTVTGVHLVQLLPATPDDPQEHRALSPTPDWELRRDVWAAWLARLPPQCRWMTTDPCPHRTNTTASPPLPSPPSPRAALHGIARGTPLMHKQVMEGRKEGRKLLAFLFAICLGNMALKRKKSHGEVSAARAAEPDFVEAKKRKLASWDRCGVYASVPERGQTVVTTRWVNTERVLDDSTVSPKSRPVARGVQQADKDSLDTSSPTVDWKVWRVMVAMTVVYGWVPYCFDISTPFLQRRWITRDVLLHPLP